MRRLVLTTATTVAAAVAVAVVALLVIVAVTGCGSDFLSPSSSSAQNAPKRLSGSTSTGRFVGKLSNGAPVCSGGVSSDAFSFGLCVCGDAAFAGDLDVHGLDASSASSASAASNGDWSRAGASTIEGDLVVGGEMAGAGDDNIGGKLDVGLDFTQAGVVFVGTDARVGGDAIGAGVVDIAGSLTIPADALLIGVSSDSVVRADVNIAAPCDCDDTSSTHVDVAAFVEQARAANDDAAVGLDANGLVNAGDVELTLPGGRYFVEELTQAGLVTIHAQGDVELFVAGDVATAGVIAIDVEPGFTFDLFVGGNVASAGVLDFDGDAAAFRVYVDGTDGVAIAGDEEFNGALFVPHGTLASAGDLRVAGAVVAHDLAAAGVIDIGFASGFANGDNADCTTTSTGDPPPASDDGNGDDDNNVPFG